MIKITVEELDIVVQASVEQALIEFKKIVPQLKKTIKQVESNLSNIETKGMLTKVQQGVQQVKQKISEVKNTSVDKQLQSQFDKAGASVEKYQGQLEEAKQKLRQVYVEMDNIQANTWKQYTPEGVELGNKAIEPTVNNALGDNKEYQGLSKEATKLEQQIQTLNSKLNTTKQEYGQIAEQIQQIYTKQSVWSRAVEKVKNTFSSLVNVTSKIKGTFNQLPKITSKISAKITQMGKGMKQGIGHVLKYAAALISLESIYGAISGIANAWLTSQNAGAQQLRANIEYMKYALGNALAPVIQTITNLVYQLLKVIQSVVYALTGINIFAKASAKSYKRMESSAKKVAEETKQLAGVHDEINNIQVTNPENGSSSGGSVAPSFDLSQADSQMSALGQKLYDFFKPIVDSWNKYGSIVVEAAKNAINGILASVSVMWESIEDIITNGTIYSILANILNSIGAIGQAWTNAWKNDNNGTEIIQSIANMINDITQAILNLVSSTGFQDFLNGVLTAISGIVQFLEPVISGFSEMSGVILEIVMSSIGELLTTIGNALQSIAKNETAVTVLEAVGAAIAIVVAAIGLWNAAQAILNGLIVIFSALTSPITLIILAITGLIAALVYLYQNFETVRNVVNGAIESIKNAFINLYNEHLKPLIDNIISLLQTLWNDILKPLIDWFVINVLPVLQPIFESLWNTISSVIGSIMNILGGVIQALKGIIEFIAGVFSGDWEKAWQGICDFFSGIWNAIKSVVSTVWNAISGTISTVIETVKGIITTVLNAISTVWNNIWNGIKNTVVNVWNGIWGAIKSVINAILGGIEGFVNGVIKGINWVLGGISDVANAVGSLIGLDPISLQLSTISLPRLAKGAVLRVPTIAEMAEYPGASTNPEIVTPQNIMEETFDRVMSRYQDNNSSRNEGIKQLVIQFGSHKVAVEMESLIRQAHRRNGTASITI